MSDVLRTLQVTTWYKAAIAVAAAAFLITLATQRDNLALIFGGAFLIALGEWKNHPKEEHELRPTVTGHWAKITNVPRKTTWFSTILQLLGAALVLYGTCRAIGITIPLDWFPSFGGKAAK